MVGCRRRGGGERGLARDLDAGRGPLAFVRLADRPLGHRSLGSTVATRRPCGRRPVPVVGSVTPPRQDTKSWEVVVQWCFVTGRGGAGPRARPAVFGPATGPPPPRLGAEGGVHLRGPGHAQD